MSKPSPRSLMQTRRNFLLLPLALLASRLASAESSTTPALPSGACPLNSGGPSLLGSRWRLFSVYGTQVPGELEISMEVGESSLKGFGGCNEYVANFQRVGHTGFMINDIAKGRAGCPILRPGPGMPSINVGDWEGSYIRTLQRAGSVEQRGNTLHFFNRSGEPSVIFAKKYGDGATDNGIGSAPPASDNQSEVADAPATDNPLSSLFNGLGKLISGGE
ncbi:MAG: META domain-containing protein [Gammaproteobacteria bacterium]|nr:META domain-containing protein [Gammaproteobacteria bacterium]MBU1723228.1 META domain-containing protein [Gammaproteobacteria bacterium]MBU2007253.1 META domain-containing protein [Gammaproteobacteria bacterium]